MEKCPAPQHDPDEEHLGISLPPLIMARHGTCTYCGSIGAITEDHVPPLCLFGKNPPAGLPTVPSCRRCNNGASLDDEYLLAMLVMKDSVSGPAASEAREALFRGLRRPQKRRFRERLIRQMRRVSVRTPAGLHLGFTQGYDVDFVRLGRVVSRMTRGLYLHEVGERLEPAWIVRSYAEDGFALSDFGTRREVAAAIEFLARQPRTVLGADVVSYSYVRAQDQPSSTQWLFTFYRTVHFISFSVPAESGDG